MAPKPKRKVKMQPFVEAAVVAASEGDNMKTPEKRRVQETFKTSNGK